MGCSMISQDDFKTSSTKLKVSVACTEKQNIVAEAVLREKVLGTTTFSVAERTPAELSLEVGKSQGALRLTLFNENKTPLAERLIYRGRGQTMRVTLKPDKQSYMPREKVTLNVLATDLDNKPVEADLGLSVVDDTVLSYADDKTANLITHIFLEKELGSTTIEDPNFYFSDKPEAAEALDLVMGTKGYRRFEWSIIQAGDIDSDTVIDLKDKCPIEAETINKYKDDDGCPELDSDYDGVVDEKDKCPSEAEDFNGYKDDDGCPEKDTDYDGIPDGKDKCPNTPEDFNSYKDDDGCPDDPAFDGITNDKDKCPYAAEDFNGKHDEDGCPEIKPKKGEAYGSFGLGLRGARIGGSGSSEGTIGLGSVSVVGKGSGSGASGAAKKPSAPKKVLRPKPLMAANGPQVAALVDGAAAPKEKKAKNTEDIDPATGYSRVRVFPQLAYMPGYTGTRDDFRETIYWKPQVKTDKTGKARVSFYLSDSITSFKAITEGFSAKGLPGRGEANIQAKLPLSLEVMMPLEVSEGDQIQLPVTISNETSRAMSASVKASFGKSFVSGANPAEKPIELKAGEKRAIFYTLTVVGKRESLTGSGQGEVTLSAEAEGLKDEVSKKINVVPLGFPAEKSFSGTLQSKATHQLDLTAAVKDTSDAIITLYPSPLASMVKGAEGILREPSGCFEQTSLSYVAVVSSRYAVDKGPPRMRRLRIGYSFVVRSPHKSNRHRPTPLKAGSLLMSTAPIISLRAFFDCSPLKALRGLLGVFGSRSFSGCFLLFLLARQGRLNRWAKLILEEIFQHAWNALFAHWGLARSLSVVTIARRVGGVRNKHRKLASVGDDRLADQLHELCQGRDKLLCPLIISPNPLQAR
jgi:hypothetical protein